MFLVGDGKAIIDDAVFGKQVGNVLSMALVLKFEDENGKNRQVAVGRNAKTEINIPFNEIQ